MADAAAFPTIMTLLPIAAGKEGIIWVIILIFWSIAQYVQKSRAAQRRPPTSAPPPPLRPTRPPTQVETQLQDLLRELTGQPPPMREEEMEEDDRFRPEPPPPRPPLIRTPPPPPVRRIMPVAQESTSAGLPAYVASVGDLSEGLGGAFANSGKMPGLTLKMPNVSLRGVSYSGSSNVSRSSGAIFNVASLRNPATLRQMLIGRMILEKPKALETAPTI